jgi:hypothetical protein
VSEITKILINMRHSQWCTCAMKNNDESVLCTQRPWFIKAFLLIAIIVRRYFNPKKIEGCWSLPRHILLTIRCYWNRMYTCNMLEANYNLEIFCQI